MFKHLRTSAESTYI